LNSIFVTIKDAVDLISPSLDFFFSCLLKLVGVFSSGRDARVTVRTRVAVVTVEDSPYYNVVPVAPARPPKGECAQAPPRPLATKKTATVRRVSSFPLRSRAVLVPPPRVSGKKA
jgi:hypothetical protein